ncbi:hypothetical protein PIB30_043815 [Stylosanthes scabra]|uniref:Transposase MuDR plant domain-containing protein n=1 Tax=Stylosanthes scabra TaxID=79078 RepID=A0ABU6UG68_9FABA|nr:hypothetical protein [Stylosanthes scabra]
MGLEQLKDFILRSIGECRRRVQKVYYRFPHDVDGIFHFKIFCLRYDDDVARIRDWHIHLGTFPLLELYAILIDEGDSSEADSQSGGGVNRNIRRLMVDLNRLPEGSSEGSIPDSNIPMPEILDSHDESVVRDPATHDYQLNHDSDDDQEDNESIVVPQVEEDDDEEEDEVEEQGGGPDDDPVDEFEVGQQLDDKEAVLMAVKTYSIRRAVEYKILESDRLKYAVKCANFGQVCQWALRVTYRRRLEKWEVRRYNGPHSCQARPPPVGLKGYSRCDIFDGPIGSEHKH